MQGNTVHMEHVAELWTGQLMGLSAHDLLPKVYPTRLVWHWLFRCAMNANNNYELIPNTQPNVCLVFSFSYIVSLYINLFTLGR